jgi:predicted CopG family antitoxin
MRKLVTIKISEDIYFKLVALRGKLKCKTWDELLRKIAEEFE